MDTWDIFAVILGPLIFVAGELFLITAYDLKEVIAAALAIVGGIALFLVATI